MRRLMTDLPRDEEGKPPKRTFRDPALTLIVSLAGHVDSVVIRAYTEIEEMRDAGVDVTDELAAHVYRKHEHAAKTAYERAMQKRIALQQFGARASLTVGMKAPRYETQQVYFIRWGDRVKIGTAIDPAARAIGLSLRAEAIVLTIPGGRLEEAAVHADLYEYRIGDTEWFHATQEVLAYIEALRHQTAGCVGPEDVIKS